MCLGELEPFGLFLLEKLRSGDLDVVGLFPGLAGRWAFIPPGLFAGVDPLVIFISISPNCAHKKSPVRVDRASLGAVIKPYTLNSRMCDLKYQVNHHPGNSDDQAGEYVNRNEDVIWFRHLGYSPIQPVKAQLTRNYGRHPSPV